MEYPNAWGRPRLIKEVLELKKKVKELEEARSQGEMLKEFVQHITQLRNDPRDRKGKRWDILSDVLNSLCSEADELVASTKLLRPRNVAMEFAALAASQPPIPPEIRERMDADRKKAEEEQR